MKKQYRSIRHSARLKQLKKEFDKKRNIYITSFLEGEKIECINCGDEIKASPLKDGDTVLIGRGGKEIPSFQFGKPAFRCTGKIFHLKKWRSCDGGIAILGTSLKYFDIAEYKAKTILNSDKINHSWKKDFVKDYSTIDWDLINSDGITVDVKSTLSETRFKQNAVTLHSPKQAQSELMKVFVDEKGNIKDYKFVKKEGNIPAMNLLTP